jgi:DNA-binding NtrC family response regulator
MAESPESPHVDDSFRWQALFQRSREPLFLLSRQRRILFVNKAWEELTGLPAAQARGLVCKRRKATEAYPLDALANALSPPAEALAGSYNRSRRLVAGAGQDRHWWQVEFFPLQGHEALLGLLGKITLLAEESSVAATPLPEKVLALRDRIAQRYQFDQLTSELPAMQRLAEQVRLAGQTRAGVLIIGEPGTGKQFLARIIHHQGTNRERAYVALDCAGLPPTAISGVLFGAGGLMRRSEIGTIYLRQPAALPRDLQAQLNEWLAEPNAARPRIIGGLACDPAEEVKAGRLLDDLACALGTLQITVPALRHRLADLPVLVQGFLDGAPADSERRSSGLTPDAWEIIRGYSWPRNLRELSEVLAVAREQAKGNTIDAADLPMYLRQSAELDQVAGPSPERTLPLDQLLEQVERRLIVLALKMARGKKSQASKLLSIWRPRLLRRMKELGITDD